MSGFLALTTIGLVVRIFPRIWKRIMSNLVAQYIAHGSGARGTVAAFDARNNRIFTLNFIFNIYFTTDHLFLGFSLSLGSKRS